MSQFCKLGLLVNTFVKTENKRSWPKGVLSSFNIMYDGIVAK